MDYLQIAIYLVLVLLVTKPTGIYLYKVFSGAKTWLTPVVQPMENRLYRLCGIDPASEMRWTTYTLTMLIFSFYGALLLYLILRLQRLLPWNPMHFPGLTPDLAFNAAVSFVTNTNWQNYAGERTISYFSQMAGLTCQNFISAGTGIALSIALIRGLTRQTAKYIGNFWVDLTRACLYVLVPLSVVLALGFVSQGVIQNLNPYLRITTLEGAPQTIAQGPVASQLAIKMLGTNGGGFFNANSAHPFENPTPLTNMVQMLAMVIIAAGLTYTFGRFAGEQRQGWALFSAMLILLVASIGVMYWAEHNGNPILAGLGINQQANQFQCGGNMEGKEVRFGIANSVSFASATTAVSCGAVNCMHDSLTPLAGGMAMLNIALGEVVFGGVGAGLLGMLVFAILTVFIAGLMVGRTPEYLGKKIEAKEMKMAMLAILVLEACILGFSALAAVTPAGLAGRLNGGPHGLSEILYAATSTTGNNGSAFAGLSGNTVFYNTILGWAMLIGRFLYIIPIMAIAGSMASKRKVSVNSGTFPTTGTLFVGLLTSVILIVGALTFFPAYTLGPIAEYLLMQAGKVF